MKNAIQLDKLRSFLDNELYLSELSPEGEAPLTVKQLDNYIASSLRVESAFSSIEPIIEAYITFQRLCYSIDIIGEDNHISSYLLVVRIEVDIDNTQNINSNFSNCIIKKILTPNLFEVFSYEYIEFFEKYKDYIINLHNEIKIESQKEVYQKDNEAMKELLKNTAIEAIWNKGSNY